MNVQSKVKKEETLEIKELMDDVFNITSSPKRVEKKIKEFSFGALRATLKDLKEFKESLK